MRDCTQPSCCAAAGRRSRRCSTLSSIYWRDLNSLQVIWPVYRLQEIVRRLCAASIYTVIAVGNGRHSQSARAQACIPCVRGGQFRLKLNLAVTRERDRSVRSVAEIKIVDQYRYGPDVRGTASPKLQSPTGQLLACCSTHQQDPAHLP